MLKSGHKEIENMYNVISEMLHQAGRTKVNTFIMIHLKRIFGEQ